MTNLPAVFFKNEKFADNVEKIGIVDKLSDFSSTGKIKLHRASSNWKIFRKQLKTFSKFCTFSITHF